MLGLLVYQSQTGLIMGILSAFESSKRLGDHDPSTALCSTLALVSYSARTHSRELPRLWCCCGV